MSLAMCAIGSKQGRRDVRFGGGMVEGAARVCGAVAAVVLRRQHDAGWWANGGRHLRFAGIRWEPVCGVCCVATKHALQ